MNTFSLKPEKLLFGVFIIIIYGLKTIGLAPVSLHTKEPTGSSRNTSINVFLRSKIGLFYSLILSTLILVLGAFKMLILLSRGHLSSINKVLNILCYILIVCTAWFQILYWAFSQNKVAYILNRLSNVRCLLSAIKKQSSIKRTLIFLAMHTAFNVFVWISFIVFAQIYYKSLFDTAAISLPICINYWFLVEYSMVLGYIARELESLNTNLLAVREFSNDSLLMFITNSNPTVSILSNRDQLADVQLLHGVRSMLYEVSQDVADFFSFPILPVMLLFFYIIIFNIYYVAVLVISPQITSRRSPNAIIQLAASWLTMSIYPLVLLPFYVTKTTKEAKQTAHVVHKLLASTKKQEVITELEHFSLHLMHEEFSFTAYGFFTLDFQLLQSIFGAAAIYLMIIIQFMQSPKTE